MARKPDHRTDPHAGGLETDDAGGVLNGLLAGEEELDRRALWRLGSWGVAAVGAVVVAAMANQSQIGWKQDQLAAADLQQRAQQMQNIAAQTEREARRLASAIDTLNNDRDRLYTRVTSLEQGLDSVTGSIARQKAAATPSTPKPVADPPAMPGPAPAVAPVTTQTTAAPDRPAASEPSPAVSTMAKDPPQDSSIKADLPRIEGKRSELVKPDAARPEVGKSDMVKSDGAELAKADLTRADSAKTGLAKADLARSEPVKSEPPRPEAAKIETMKVETAKPELVSPGTPLVAAKSLMAPPDPSAARLAEPAKPPGAVIASPIPEVMATTDAEADEETGPKVAIQRTQFGVDLGAANSVSGLRALWRGLLKSRSNAPLAALRPIIVVREGSKGAMQLRLVAGPLNDAGAAARICAAMIENKRNCETAVFDGQRLSLTADDPAPAPSARPAARRRAPPAKRAAIVVEEAPKKPESSATAQISSWFGKKGQ